MSSATIHNEADVCPSPVSDHSTLQGAADHELDASDIKEVI